MPENQPKSQGIDRRTFIKTTAAAGAAAAITGFPAIVRSQPKEIIIGSIQPVTGPLPDIGIAMQRGNKLAADEINAKGGIKSLGGAKIKLLLGDNEAKEEVARVVAERQIKEGAVCLVGPFLSGPAMTIATLAEQRNIPFVIDVAAMDAITAKGYKNVFRCFAKTEYFMTSLGRYLDQIIKEKKVTFKRIAVTNAGDAFGRSQGAAFVKYVKDQKLPYEIVEHVEYPLGVKDLSAEVTKLKAAKPEVLFPVARPGGPITSWTTCPGSIPRRPSSRKRTPSSRNCIRASIWIPTPAMPTSGSWSLPMPWNGPSLRTPMPCGRRCGKPISRTTPWWGPVVFDEKGDNINAAAAMVQVLPDPKMDDRVKVVLPKDAAQAPYVFPWKQLWDRG
ncbi:MAG: ABC transporter substrate-binding protein [Desulfobacterota bacterium]|nr:ABC transporter substrate-binding protein [Thermodesulfobacteriota bacterium]